MITALFVCASDPRRARDLALALILALSSAGVVSSTPPKLLQCREMCIHLMTGNNSNNPVKSEIKDFLTWVPRNR
jgi:hypothetical protein